MSNLTAIPFSEYVSRKIRPYKLALPMGFSVAAGALMGVAALYNVGQSSRSLLSSVAPHVAVLIETNDRPELQRLISSITQQSGSKIDVVADQLTIASSVSRGSIGEIPNRAFKSGSVIPRFDQGYLLTDVGVSRPGGATLNAFMTLFTPVRTVLEQVLVAMIAAFVGAISMNWLLAAKMATAVRESIAPIEGLNDAIRGLCSTSPIELEPSGILEVEKFRSTLEGTKADLSKATEALSEALAKQLSQEAYRRLIHDLHTPITALRQWSKISMDERKSEGDRSAARAKMVELSEQILQQVGAGKNNLDISVRIVKGADLAQSLRKTIERARLAASERFHIQIVESLPNEPMLVDHDPILIERAVSNLITNSAEASATKVEVSARCVNGAAQIHVEDNGPGMDPEEVPLHLVGRGQSSKANRSGIGLSSCNHIVRCHGGRIVHRPSRLGGSEFEIRFRVRESEVQI